MHRILNLYLILSANTFENVACPFCGLICDDLKLNCDNMTIEADDSLPEFCRHSYRLASLDAIPPCRIKGQATEYAEAIDYIAQCIKTAHNPLFSGLALDVNGSRAVLNLAKQCGGTVDHFESEPAMRNAQVMQDEGWILSTLSEAQNRAEMIVILGVNPLHNFPRLFERLKINECGLFRQQKPEIIFIGEWSEGMIPPIVKQNPYRILPLTLEELIHCPRILNMLISSKSPIDSNNISNFSAWQNLVNDLKNCPYSIITWSAGEWESPYAELPLQTLAQFIKHLNQETRCGSMPLSGSKGIITFNQVCTWQYGSPSRTSFAKGFPEYDPYTYSSECMLATGSTDLLLWVMPLAPALPPETDIPTIAIIHPAFPAPEKVDVFIPSGIPGIDHTGHIFRTDSVVSLPLRRLRKAPLKSVTEILNDIRVSMATSPSTEPQLAEQR